MTYVRLRDWKNVQKVIGPSLFLSLSIYPSIILFYPLFSSLVPVDVVC